MNNSLSNQESRHWQDHANQHLQRPSVDKQVEINDHKSFDKTRMYQNLSPCTSTSGFNSSPSTTAPTSPTPIEIKTLAGPHQHRRQALVVGSAANNAAINNKHLHLQARPSVAGVGGTVTTVTKSKRKTAPLPRLVSKNGTVNLFVNNIDRRKYARDLFTTMIDIKWRYNLLVASLGFVSSWIFFACIWYLVLLFHNDLEHHDGPWPVCIENVKSFSAAILFSIETQSTLGFGTRIISVECPGAIVIFCIQLIFGVVVECLIVGMVFAKLSRPAKRSQTIMFSKCATVCLRNGKMCLAFRVGDVRSKSHIIGSTIKASLVTQKVTEEGEIMPFYHRQLNVKIDDSLDSLLLIWPLIIVHEIDESSPFYTNDCEQFANLNFEIITILEGTVESTGQSIQVRSSYLPSEVKWGYRFEPIVSTHGFGKNAQTIIDYNKFNKICAVDTPTCSASSIYESNKQLYITNNDTIKEMNNSMTNSEMDFSKNHTNNETSKYLTNVSLLPKRQDNPIHNQNSGGSDNGVVPNIVYDHQTNKTYNNEDGCSSLSKSDSDDYDYNNTDTDIDVDDEETNETLDEVKRPTVFHM